MTNRVVERKNMVVDMASSFYPTVFDPLAVKALKLDLLALCSLCIGSQKSEDVSQADSLSEVNLFKDGLVSVSAFKWMPPWSSETAVAFRTFYKFLIGTLSHSVDDSIETKVLMDSTIFCFLQGMIVEMTMEFQQLVPTVVSFVNRFLACNKHCWLGERLLQTLDEHLLPKVTVDYKLVAYFAVFDKIAENVTIPPRGLLELLTNLVVFLVKKHGPDTGLRSWSQGIKVLGICRTMMMHHHSSRLFLRLSRLLAFTCLYFPDLEVRDNARIYLRMLVCVPGKKLRELLKLGEQLPTMAPSGESDTFFNMQAPILSHDPRKSRNISAYIHLERVVPLLVKQSWSLSLANLGFGNAKADSIEGIKDSEPKFDDAVIGITSDLPLSSESLSVEQQLEPLRVMDARISEMLGTLRRHFLSIPDFRHTPGIKVKISCYLRFESDPFSRTWGFSSPPDNPNATDALPAIYATVLKFSSLAPYGSIPLYRIPFLLGEPPKNSNSSVLKVSSDIRAVENGAHEDDSIRAYVTIELEPRDPTPGMVDVFLETNSENGQIIQGQLHSISVGIEDMFLKAIIPSDIRDSSVPLYYSDLFTALWEACDGTSNFGRETFLLKGGKGVAAISGTRSVKLLEVPASSVIQSTERYLARFVVKVTGEPLSDLVKDSGVIKDIIWKDSVPDISNDAIHAGANFQVPLQLKYTDEEDDTEIYANYSSRNMGCIHILIFLPPRYHLLLQMEVSDASTLVRIRTDHWPCLAYIDDYLEALYLV
ncbi:AP-5 complex subunit beta-1 (Adaptor-related protein complex 5 beta subunit) [Psidium guajava]|nr:AP-5 complex subunit beta-1 (Adaptor-related protein complex 5 beta subunit) [Psidium guajava]